ncbi:hypothetical protein GHT06_011268 [Daphnia sinensis]|uniref:Uncharacterized protein n=1 Tax=Daphnia sinensis TaxID=1820382 RepID=A0AAD5L0D7_9CRUS|nr:hypothetical protein GHT06_011268 [Daphnia sinensis]
MALPTPIALQKLGLGEELTAGELTVAHTEHQILELDPMLMRSVFADRTVKFSIEIPVAPIAESLVSFRTGEGGTAIILEKNLDLSGIVQATLHGLVSVSRRNVGFVNEWTTAAVVGGSNDRMSYQSTCHDSS